MKDLAARRATFHKLTDVELIDILGKIAVRMRDSLLDGAAAFAEARDRNLPVDIQKWMAPLYHDIAAGKLDPDVIVKFGGRGHTFDSVRSKSIEEQRRLLAMPEKEVEQELRVRSTSSRQEPTLTEVIEKCMRLVRRSKNPSKTLQLLAARCAAEMADEDEESEAA